MKIYLDVCCLNRPFDDQSQDKIRLESEAVLTILERCQRDWELITSEITDYEVSKIPDEERKKKVQILMTISKEKVILDERIVKRAKELGKAGLKPMDALHAACAERSADLMLTTDEDLVRKFNNLVSELCVYNPLRWRAKELKDE